MTALNVILDNSDNVVRIRTIKKLNSLYCNGDVKSGSSYLYVKESVDSFVNLSNHELSKDEKDFLNLGLNCHLEPKYDTLHKKVEMEILYQNLLELQSKKEILVKPELADQLRAEATKHRNTKRKSLLTPSLRVAVRNKKRMMTSQ